MKLEKAIKVLNFWETLFRSYHDQTLKDALRLGIEALKAIKEERVGFENYQCRLPGETKD